MEVNNLTEQTADKINPHKNKVHHVLAHSYTVHFVLFLIGVFLDAVFKLEFFTNPTVVVVGIIFIIFGSFFVLWAQNTSRNLQKENISKEIFSKGPYRYTHSPTHWGLFFLMLGFGIVINAIFVILFTLISFLINRLYFLKKEEKILIDKYGIHYLEYKKKIKF